MPGDRDLNHYQTLHVDRAASHEAIKLAYRRMSSKLHPDKNPGRDTTPQMQAINVANAVLSDPVQRSLYDWSMGFAKSALDAAADAAFDSKLDAMMERVNEVVERANEAIRRHAHRTQQAQSKPKPGPKPAPRPAKPAPGPTKAARKPTKPGKVAAVVSALSCRKVDAGKVEMDF